jgi:hypothetical protein
VDFDEFFAFRPKHNPVFRHGVVSEPPKMQNRVQDVVLKIEIRTQDIVLKILLIQPHDGWEGNPE